MGFECATNITVTQSVDFGMRWLSIGMNIKPPMNISLNEKEYSELIQLIYWAVLEEDINYNDDFKSMCNVVRTADGSTVQANDPLFSEDFTEYD